MRKLDAIFYPEIICLHENVLKYMTLMYDRIYFLPTDIRLNPGNTSIRRRFSMNDSLLVSAFGTKEDSHYSLMYASEENVWDSKLKNIMDLYDELEESGRCVPLINEKFEEATSWHPLEKAIDVDMADKDFVKHCLSTMNPKLFIPPSPDASSIKGGGFVTRPPKYKGRESFAGICAERLNSAMYFAEEMDLLPISNHIQFEALLGLKLKRAIARQEQVTKTEKPSNSARFGMLSWHVVTEIVPPKLISSKSIKQIEKYKTECKEQHEKFIKHLELIDLRINEMQIDAILPERIKKVVKLEMVPEIEKLRDQKKVIWEKLFNEVIKTTFSKKLLVPLLSMHFMPNMSYGELLLYSSAGYLGSVLPSLIDSRQSEKEIRKNAMFFLLNFK